MKINRAIVIPVRDNVHFPGINSSMGFARQETIRALKQAQQLGLEVILVPQKDINKVEGVSAEDLYEYGTLAKLDNLRPTPDGNVIASFQNLKRVKVGTVNAQGGVLLTSDSEAVDDVSAKPSTALSQSVKEMVDNAQKFFRAAAPGEADDIMADIHRINGVSTSVDYLVTCVPVDDMPISEKIAFLAESNVEKRVQMAAQKFAELETRIRVAREVDQNVAGKTKADMEKQQREYYIAQQIKALREQLGEEGEDEIAKLREKIEAASLPADVKKKALKEVKRLEGMAGPMGGGMEANVIRNWLENVLETPWKKEKTPAVDINQAKATLEEDHYGMERVKDRILEYLAVQERLRKQGGKSQKPTIICLDGPPGTGKTSILQSVAKAAGRKYVRLALGGINNEADVRGHRKTYVGAMPGRLIKAMQEAGVSNPLIVLDEIDKVSSGNSMHGDPTSALLEVLDPSQNKAFKDHYLEVDYDLSDVVFIATSNYLQNIPAPLRDRMEIISIPGYTVEEKLEIAKRHLVRRALSNNALTDKELKFSDSALALIAEGYTAEAGVRKLTEAIDTVARKVATKIEQGGIKSITIDENNLSDFLGPIKRDKQAIAARDTVGLTQGLYYSAVGGGVLPIEAVKKPAVGTTGTLQKTGSIKEVMSESVNVALGYLQSNHDKFLGISDAEAYKKFFKENDIQIHFPDGATPKDGPSAGLAIATTLASLLTGIPVRRDIAMTGEINLRGEAGKIGGLKEKLLGALNAGVKTAFIPRANAPDLQDMPEAVLKGLEIVIVDHVDQILEKALVSSPFAPGKKPAVEQNNTLGVARGGQGRNVRPS